MGLIFQNLKTFKQAKNEALSPVNKQCYKIRKLNLIFSNKNNIKNKYWSRKPNLCIRLDHLHHNFRIEVYQICFFAWLSYPYFQSLIFNLDHKLFFFFTTLQSEHVSFPRPLQSGHLWRSSNFSNSASLTLKSPQSAKAWNLKAI